MAKLPTARDLGTASIRGGIGQRRASAADFFEGSNGGFGQIAGSFLRGIGKKLDEKQNLEAEVNFTKFAGELDRGQKERERQMQPGGDGFFAGEQAELETRSSAFLESLPPSLREKYAVRIARTGERFLNNANNIHSKELDRYQGVLVDDGLTEVEIDINNSPDDVDGFIKHGENLIRQSSLTPAEKDIRLREWRKNARFLSTRRKIETDPNFAKGFVGISDNYVDKIIGVESGGNPDAKNPRSSATGLGQFISSTWKQFINERHPDLKAKGSVLKFRSDPELSREAVEWYAQKNAAVLRKANMPVTDATVYLAHFAGPEGAVKILQNRDKSASEILGAGAVKANPFLKGKDGQDVVNWAARKMGQNVEGLSPNDVGKLAKYAQQTNSKIATAEKAERAAYKDDIALKIETDPNYVEQDLLADPVLDSGDKAQFVKRIRSRDKKQIEETKLLKKALNRDYVWQPNSEGKKAADLIVDKAGIVDGVFKGDEMMTNRALAMVKLSNLVPPSIENVVKTMIDSQDSATVEMGYDMLDRMYQINPDIVHRDMNKATVNRLMNYRGLQGLLPRDEVLSSVRSSGDAIKDSIRKDREKIIDKELRDLSLDDVVGALSNDNWILNEAPSQNTETQSRMMLEYKNVLRERYLQTGNAEMAQQDAIDITRANWKPSAANNGRLMKDPPEKYYPRVDGSWDWMEDQINKDLREHFGDLEYFNHELVPVRGRPGKYNISVQGEGGVFDLVRNKDNQPLLYVFDPAEYIKKSRAKFQTGEGGAF